MFPCAVKRLSEASTGEGMPASIFDLEQVCADAKLENDVRLGAEERRQ